MKHTFPALILAFATLSASALGQREVFTLEGSSAADGYGALVRSAGDVDADGTLDFMVASRAGLGRVFVYSGATQRLIHDLQGTWGSFGRSMDALGDVDGDGFGDFAISETPGGGSPPSFVYVYSGASGAVLFTLSAAAAAVGRLGATIEGIDDVDGDGRSELLVLATGGQVICYSGATGSEVFRLMAPGSGLDFGLRLAGLGDLDGDGVGDFAVSDTRYLATQPSIVRGRAIVYSGATRSQLFTVDGGPSTRNFAKALSDAGDVDGDGLCDLLVGSEDLSIGGFVQVISGGTGAEIRRLEPAVSGEVFGDAVSGAGDVDGDGTDDILVGSPRDSSVLVNAGIGYVFSGSTGRELFRVEGTTISEWVGASVAGAGDLDGDGRAEVLFGRPRLGTAAQDPGRVSCHTLGPDARVLDFEFDEDGITALENGRSVDSNARFGAFVRVDSLGTGHVGAAIFDSSPNGPNAASADPDLLVDRGNLLILQGDPRSSAPGVFDWPDDFAEGGTLRVEFRSPATLVSVDLVDICPGPDGARVQLVDGAGRVRTYQVPAGFTTDGLSDPQRAVRALRLDTLSPQRGVSATATASEDSHFDADGVLALEVYLESSGAIDDVRYVPSGLPRVDELGALYSIPNPPGIGFGFKLRSMSDIDGDGVREILGNQQSGPTGLGVARVFSGATGALLQEFPAQQAGSLFGDFAAGVGDVDADGIEDIGVGGWGFARPGEIRNGVVRIYSGRTFAELYEFVGEAGSRTGTAIERLDDLDGDGHDEFIVGSNSANGNRGRLDVRSGATGSVVYSIIGSGPDVLEGSWVRNMGDVDQDGVDDIFTAAGGLTSHFYVYSGADGALLHEIPGAGYGSKPAGDVDRDGYPDVLLKDSTSSSLYVQVLSGRDWSVLHEVRGVPALVSEYRTAPAGDQDGDGHADFVVDAPYDPIGMNPSGRRIQVLSGRTGLVLFEQAMEGSTTLEFAGDLDGDGFAELLRKGPLGVEVLAVQRRHGFAICDGEVNSTGRGARLRPQGSFAVATGSPRIQAADLPPRATALLVCSSTFGRIVQPVLGGATSGGDLCIAGGPISRLALGVSSPGGQLTFPLEVSRLLPAGMPLSSLVGETRLFQCVYRDVNGPTGGAFSDAVVARFE